MLTYTETQTATLTITRTATTTIVTTIVPPPPSPSPVPTPGATTTAAGAKKISCIDRVGDAFDAVGGPFPAEAYLDIVRAEVQLIGTSYLFRMELAGPLPPVSADPLMLLEWDFFIDADRNANTGAKNPLLANDIGAEYMVRLLAHNGQVRGELMNFIDGKAYGIAPAVAGSVIDLSFTWTMMQQLSSFDCVAAARRIFDGVLIAADRAPDEAHLSLLE
jgi:hypothetical protein